MPPPTGPGLGGCTGVVLDTMKMGNEFSQTIGEILVLVGYISFLMGLPMDVFHKDIPVGKSSTTRVAWEMDARHADDAGIEV